MTVAIDDQGDLSLYGGPVSSFYSFTVPAPDRMTDEAWQQKLAAGAPPRPGFPAYRAP
jgi:hypothetical protein